MAAKSMIVVAGLILIIISPVLANTITLPGSYESTPSDIIVLNAAHPDKTITYNLGILRGNDTRFGLDYANLNAQTESLGDTVGIGFFGIFHGNDQLLSIDNVQSCTFAETSLAVTDMVDDEGVLQLSLSLATGSDPLAFYRPWLYITDDIPPSVIGDIQVTHSFRNGLRLEWTAVGDNNMDGVASLYEIRYSKWPLEGDTAEWWGYAEQAGDIPYPGEPGSHETTIINGLDTASTYYLIIVAYDEVGNRSAFSNVAVGSTGEGGGEPGTNYCLEFNGINMRAVIPNTDNLNPTEQITIEAWINCRNFTRWTQGFILGKSYPEYRYPFSQYFLAVTSIYTEYASITTADGIWHKLDTGPILLELNQWTHLSFTYDGSYLKLYVNGEFDQSTPVQGEILTWPYDIYIGILEYLDGWGFDGFIDEIRIWEIARSQDEIRSTMSQRLTGNEAGLVGYWNFDEGDGQEFYDLTSYGSDGYLGRDPGPDSDDPSWATSEAPLEGYAVGAEPGGNIERPMAFGLEQNYPNPFNSSTRISFNLSHKTPVQLEIYDMLGRQVISLHDGALDSGNHAFVWDGRSMSGQALSSGIYFYRLRTDKLDQTRKMLLVK